MKNPTKVFFNQPFFMVVLVICLMGIVFLFSRGFVTQQISQVAFFNKYFGTSYQTFDELVIAHGLVVVDIKIKKFDFKMAIADNSLKSKRGLSGLQTISGDQGMLYVFPVLGQYEFSTMGMKFNLDMVWLDDLGKVVYVEQDLKPDSEVAFKPPVKSMFVMELPVGTVSKTGLKVGDVVSIPNEVIE